MNPCLSGWDVGEAKQEYMHLCHRVLSRSQLNAVIKLKEAGINSSNLIVLPSMSNISLGQQRHPSDFGKQDDFGKDAGRWAPDSAIGTKSTWATWPSK